MRDPPISQRVAKRKDDEPSSIVLARPWFMFSVRKNRNMNQSYSPILIVFDGWVNIQDSIWIH